MVEIKKYTKKTGRDPEKYLGIDGSTIPFEYFKNYFIPMAGDLISDVMSYNGTSFYITGEGAKLADNQGDSYVSKEDLLAVEEWFILGKAAVEQEINSDIMTLENLKAEKEFVDSKTKEIQNYLEGKGISVADGGMYGSMPAPGVPGGTTDSDEFEMRDLRSQLTTLKQYSDILQRRLNRL